MVCAGVFGSYPVLARMRASLLKSDGARLVAVATSPADSFDASRTTAVFAGLTRSPRPSPGSSDPAFSKSIVLQAHMIARWVSRHPS